MTRYQFFSLLESNLEEMDTHSDRINHSKPNAPRHNPNRFGGTRASSAADAAESFTQRDAPGLRGKVEHLMNRVHNKLPGNAKSRIATGAGVLGLGLAARHLGRTAEPSNMLKIIGAEPSNMQKIIGAVKNNKGKALAAGAAGLGGMMFLRHKPKSNRK